MTLNKDSISATIKLELRPWGVPNFAVRAGESDDIESIPVRDLDEDALEDLALAWVRDLYKKAGRSYCPFHKPVRSE